MILKSYLLEQNISLIDKYFINLIYGENIGMKDDIKDQMNKVIIEDGNLLSGSLDKGMFTKTSKVCCYYVINGRNTYGLIFFYKI